MARAPDSTPQRPAPGPMWSGAMSWGPETGPRIEQPGELLLEESTANEKVIALWRLVFCLVAAVQLVVIVSFDQPTLDQHDWVALAGVFVAVLYSAGLFVAVGQLGYSPTLSFFSVGIDITLITGALLGLAISGQPMFAVNNPVAIPLYLLAISLAGLRYNPRITVFATLLAALE